MWILKCVVGEELLNFKQHFYTSTRRNRKWQIDNNLYTGSNITVLTEFSKFSWKVMF